MYKNKRVTIKYVADLAGVSTATASLVLNGRGKELRVSEATRERVLSIAQQQNYQPNIHARSLRYERNRILTLGLVVPDITNYGFAVFSFELETLCREAGIQLIISCTDENPSQETIVVNNMISRQIDGLIVASCMLSDDFYLKISEQFPVVLFDRYIQGSQLPSVFTESIQSVSKLIAPIARHSPDEIYFLGGPPRLSPTRDRLEGFIQGLQQSGVTLRPEWVIHGKYHSSTGYEMFAELCTRLGRPPKAIFTAACGLLEGVLRYMHQHNIRDKSVYLTSFDDHPLYHSLSLPIDTISQNYHQLALYCYTLVSQLIHDETPEILNVCLPASIKKRITINESVG